MAPLVLALAGCGDVLADGDYPGEPLLVVTGQVLVEDSIPDDVSPSVALFWTEAGADNRSETAVEVTTRFPSFYELRVYQPPDDADFFEDPRGDHLALAVVLLYDDADGDGQLGAAPDAVIGAAEESHVVWFTEPPGAAPDTPTGAYTVAHGVPTCAGGPPPDTGGPPEAGVGEADLVVADVCTLLPDWNCDGRLEEWRDLCG